MFVPNLDLGNDWENLGVVTSQDDIFPYSKIVLPWRTDAIRVNVTTTSNNANWIRAGDVKQLWKQDGNTYQVAYHQVFLTTQSVFPVEPLAQSELIYTPVDWLLNWTIEVKARRYTPTDNVLLSEILSNQAIILDKLESIEANCSNSNGTGGNTLTEQIVTSYFMGLL